MKEGSSTGYFAQMSTHDVTLEDLSTRSVIAIGKANANNGENSAPKTHCQDVAMAKGKKQQRKKGSQELGEFDPPLNPLNLQKMMAQAMAVLLGDEPHPEESEAAKILDKAFRANSPKQAEKLARQALQIDPGQLGAYELLDELAGTPENAIAMLENSFPRDAPTQPK
ncbi:MAG: hypothetical protein K8R36_23545 [Planctomycetales bacterium]|nr:hypothetical protein [Planctomycetales bacterium]